MDGLLTGELSLSQLSASRYSSQIKLSEDSLVIQTSLVSVQKDRYSFDFSALNKSLQIKAQKIVEKLNELLKADLPDGLQSLKPEDVTPEATADRIVQGATAFFGIFAKQNPDLSDEELLNKFMDTIRSGVKQGYDEAFGILKGLGAFEIEGVQDGVEKTLRLIEEKLGKYEDMKREELGLAPKNSTPQLAEKVGYETGRDLLSQAGSTTLNRIV